MISKERLKELIEQCATIYELDVNSNIFPLDLRDYQDVKIEEVEKYSFNRLYEHEEEAEWHKEFGCIERTKRLELPTWEEIEKVVLSRFYYFTDCYGRKCCLSYMKPTNLLQLAWMINEEEEEWLCEEWELTKENYTLACRKCKELFLGE